LEVRFRRNFICLLESLGFGDGNWVVRSRRESPLLFGDEEREAVADVSVIDISSDDIVRLCVVEDKSNDEERSIIRNSEAQLIAEGIAASQQNKNFSKIYMLRVIGQSISFYYGDLQKLSHIVKKGEVATEKTVIKRFLFKSKRGHELVEKEERNIIIYTLDIIRQILANQN